MKLLIGLLACALVAWLVVYLFGMLFSQTARDNRSAKKASAKDLTAARQRERIATQALRKIANGAGAPLVEAEEALFQIEKTYDTKEIA